MIDALSLHQRRRLERDLHDGAQQRLVSLALTLRMALEKLGPDAGEAGLLLDRSRRELDEALAHRPRLPVEVGELPADRLPVAKHASATHASVCRR